MMLWKGKAKRIDDLDLPRIGHMIGVDEDIIHMLIDVEAGGKGFYVDGRLKVLYEPHVAYRLTNGEVRDDLVRAGVAYRDWGMKRYPRDSYPRIETAMEIAGSTALLASSWGACQMMGFNALSLGYDSVEDMVRRFADDEAEHIYAMVRFIMVNGLDDELRAVERCNRKEDALPYLHTIARTYNGPGYRKNNYHNKLWSALARWRGYADTPWNKDDDPEWDERYEPHWEKEIT